MSVSKADVKTYKAAMAALEKKIKKNTIQNKSNLVAMEAIDLQLQTSITENNTQFKEKAGQIKNDITLFKEEFDARLLELSAYEEQIGHLRKSISLIDKKLKEINLEKISKKELDQRFNHLRLSLEKMIQDLDTKLEQTKPGKLPPVKKMDSKPVPQLDTGEIKSENISEETLNQ